MLKALQRFLGRRHDLPATPPRPQLTPEEEAVAREQREDGADERPADRPDPPPDGP